MKPVSGVYAPIVSISRSQSCRRFRSHAIQRAAPARTSEARSSVVRRSTREEEEEEEEGTDAESAVSTASLAGIGYTFRPAHRPHRAPARETTGLLASREPL